MKPLLTPEDFFPPTAIPEDGDWRKDKIHLAVGRAIHQWEYVELHLGELFSTLLMLCPLEGDVLIVTRLDRLARSTRDLLNLLGTIAVKGAGFKSLRDTCTDILSAPKWVVTQCSRSSNNSHLATSLASLCVPKTLSCVYRKPYLS